MNLWDSWKYPATSRPTEGQTSSFNSETGGFNSLSGLYCINLTTTTTDVEVLRFVNTNTILEVLVSELVILEVSGRNMVIKTKDEVYFYLTFVNINECKKTEDRIFRIMNTNTDFGCIL